MLMEPESCNKEVAIISLEGDGEDEDGVLVFIILVATEVSGDVTKD